MDAERDDTLKKERKLDQLLRQLRILGRIKIVTWEHVKDEFKLSADSATESEAQGAAVAGISKPCPTHVADEFLHGVNELIKNQSSASVVTFLYYRVLPGISATTLATYSSWKWSQRIYLRQF